MQTEIIIELAERNGGGVTAAMAHEAWVERSLLRHLCRTGRLECVERGVYAMPESWVDEPYIAQIRFGRGVFSHNTALWLHGLSDRTPSGCHEVGQFAIKAACALQSSGRVS